MARPIAALARVMCLAVFLIAGMSAVWAADAPQQDVQNAVLVCWDGLDRSVLKELLEAGRLPNIAGLAKEGSVQDIEVRGHTTATAPSVAEMITGLGANDTGVYSDQSFKPIPEGCTIFERVQKHLGGKDKIRALVVTGKAKYLGGWGADDIQDSQDHQTEATPKTAANEGKETPANAGDALIQPEGALLYLTKKNLDVFDAARRDADKTGPLCLKYLAQCKEPRFLAFLHFSDPDNAGHKHGMDSPEYRNAAMLCDEWLGKIVKWLKDEKLYDKTLIYVITDHGFDKPTNHHILARHSWLVTNDKCVNRGGTIADVPATILARFGINPEDLTPKLIGTPLLALESAASPAAGE